MGRPVLDPPVARITDLISETLSECQKTALVWTDSPVAKPVHAKSLGRRPLRHIDFSPVPPESGPDQHEKNPQQRVGCGPRCLGRLSPVALPRTPLTRITLAVAKTHFFVDSQHDR